jgi:hypothetical protein
VQDLHDILKDGPVYVEDSYSDEVESDASDDILPADLPVPLKYDPYLSLRPFTEAQSRAYYSLMPANHG